MRLRVRLPVLRPRLRRFCAYGALALLTASGACTAKKSPPVEEGVPPSPAPLQRTDSELPERSLPAQEQQRREVPVQLTASDGTGLRLVSLQARGVVQGPLALTELHLSFDNPEDRTIEGRFTIDLPPDSAISRFAMKIGSRWQEGEVVERQAARVAYEDFLHRKQDPALLENQAGNRFSARVFPIPARGRKELILSYSQELTDSSVPYKLMLAGLPQLEKLDVEVRVDEVVESGGATTVGGRSATRRVIQVDKENYVPERDLEVQSAKATGAVGLRHDNLAMVRVQALGDMPADPIEDLTIVFDTSASRALGFASQVHRLGRLVDKLRSQGDFRLRVVAFDQDLSLVYDGAANDFGADALTAIYSRRALGASDLAGVLRRLARVGGASRVLVVTDGIATAGAAEVADLEAAVLALGEAGVRRLDALIDGGLQDRDALTAMTTAGLARDGIVVDARLDPEEIASKLRRATLSDVSVSVPGSTFVWPSTVDGVQPGDEVLVYAMLPEDAAMKVVLAGEQTTETEVALTTVDGPLLKRAMVGARIDALTLQRSGFGNDAVEERRRLKAKIIGLSTKHRVLSDFTALLVLETERDYQRFNIDRNALSDIMTVGASGIELVQRKEVTYGTHPSRVGMPAPSHDEPIPQLARNFDPGAGTGAEADDDGHFLASPAPEAPRDDKSDVAFDGLEGSEVGEASAADGLGLVGTGRGGGGTGEGTIGLGNVGLIGKGGGGGTGSGYGRGRGAGFGGISRRVPRVRMAKAEVRGSLDKDIIRRIVRAHINEVRHCQNQGLVRDPTLKGRVAVQFSIAPTGKVPVATVRESTVSDRQVGECIAKAVKRWKFPKPRGGGTVVVTYPFELLPADPPRPPPTPEELEAMRLAQEARRAEQQRRDEERRRREAEAERTKDSPYEGKMFDVMSALDGGRVPEALQTAMAWREDSPGDVLALVALGEVLERQGKARAAARVYGSLIDLFPSRADLRRFAGHRLERLETTGRALAVDTYRHAVAQRPDHPNSHRLLAYALLRNGEAEAAFEAIVAGAKRDYPSGRFREVHRILREDAGLIAAAWLAAQPQRESEIGSRAREADVTVATEATTRFVISWETDANDVDFHIHDGEGNHAYYSDPALPSGGALYADVTTGYGPECFTISGGPNAFPYRFEAHYYSRGPMGYGMGKLQILQHDGKGTLQFDERPFVIMKDKAFVKLGEMKGPLR